jgi:hypothetical protein
MFKLIDWLFDLGPFEDQTWPRARQRVCIEEDFWPGAVEGAGRWYLYYSDGSLEVLEVRGK